MRDIDGEQRYRFTQDGTPSQDIDVIRLGDLPEALNSLDIIKQLQSQIKSLQTDIDKLKEKTNE